MLGKIAQLRGRSRSTFMLEKVSLSCLILIIMGATAHSFAGKEPSSINSTVISGSVSEAKTASQATTIGHGKVVALKATQRTFSIRLAISNDSQKAIAVACGLVNACWALAVYQAEIEEKPKDDDADDGTRESQGCGA